MYVKIFEYYLHENTILLMHAYTISHYNTSSPYYELASHTTFQFYIWWWRFLQLRNEFVLLRNSFFILRFYCQNSVAKKYSSYFLFCWIVLCFFMKSPCSCRQCVDLLDVKPVFEPQARHQYKIQKVFIRWFPLSRYLVKTLRINKIAMKSF